MEKNAKPHKTADDLFMTIYISLLLYVERVFDI